MGLIILGGIASSTFSNGGPGAAIVQLMLIAGAGASIEALVRAMNKGQIANMIKTLSIFICIGIVVKQIIAAIKVVCTGFGIQL